MILLILKVMKSKFKNNMQESKKSLQNKQSKKSGKSQKEVIEKLDELNTNKVFKKVEIRERLKIWIWQKFLKISFRYPLLKRFNY